MRGGAVPIHIQRWAPADFQSDEHVKFWLFERDYEVYVFYRQFLDVSFIQGGDLPADPRRLAAVLSLPLEVVEKGLDACLGKVIHSTRTAVQSGSGSVPEDDERLFQRRVKAEIEAELEFRAEQAEKGKKSGKVRRKKAAQRSKTSSNNKGSNRLGTAVQSGSNRTRTEHEPNVNPPAPAPAPTPSPIGGLAPAPAREAPPEAAAAESEDMQYFRQIEEHLNRERGTTRRLDPEDYQLARRWREEGVPIDLVRQAVSTVCAKHRERGDRDLIQTLRYCRSEVEQQWAGVEKLQAPGRRDEPPEPLDVASRLAGVARLLPPDLPDRERWAGEIEALEGQDPEEVEAGLDRIDGAILTAASEALDDAEREALETEAKTAITAHVDRLPEREREEAKERIARRLLRKRIGLPRLSLFAPGVEEAA